MQEERAFPKEWKWDRYEPVFREWMAQCARLIDGTDKLSEKEHKAHHMLSELWRREQVDKGRLPPNELRNSDEYIFYLDRILTKAKADLRDGQLKLGMEHLKLGKRIMDDPVKVMRQLSGEGGDSKPARPRFRDKIAGVRDKNETELHERKRRRHRR
jgi:hypothetical protein